ncbi:RWD domain containing [Arthrobotrys musiformis]|uniref:RWD domain containing n=1 Tax=Arthrobotrys musiformis TaxID=47236 RepID=A0AAV9W1C9_9PEZI
MALVASERRTVVLTIEGRVSTSCLPRHGLALGMHMVLRFELFWLVEFCKWARNLKVSRPTTPPRTQVPRLAPPPIEACTMIFSRVFFMFHHIRSKIKRKSIRTMAESMDIRGVCKPGYPGFLYVEGEDSAIRTYVKEIKRMKWQSVEVRRNVQETIPDAVWETNKLNKSCKSQTGRLGGPFTVVEVETSAEMSRILREAGLGDFLQKAMTGSHD